MPLNTGYLKAGRTGESDEKYTPYYAVDPIIKYIKKSSCVWTPFDREWSAFYQSFKERGYHVIRSDISDGRDFFEYEPCNYDCIVSNPPFTQKRQGSGKTLRIRKAFRRVITA